jgi:hypothetical protein
MTQSDIISSSARNTLHNSSSENPKLDLTDGTNGNPALSTIRFDIPIISTSISSKEESSVVRSIHSGNQEKERGSETV